MLEFVRWACGKEPGDPTPLTWLDFEDAIAMAKHGVNRYGSDLDLLGQSFGDDPQGSGKDVVRQRIIASRKSLAKSPKKLEPAPELSSTQALEAGRNAALDLLARSRGRR